MRGGNIGLHQILGGPIPADQRFACHTDQDPQLGGVFSPPSLCSRPLFDFPFYLFIPFSFSHFSLGKSVLAWWRQTRSPPQIPHHRA